jgi:hypothetical protein
MQESTVKLTKIPVILSNLKTEPLIPLISWNSLNRIDTLLEKKELSYKIIPPLLDSIWEKKEEFIMKSPFFPYIFKIPPLKEKIF